MKKEMLINCLAPEEIRIAILEDGVLEELYVERASHESYVGNIYKGRIVNIEPSIQAAFVDFGVGRNGFLHVSDVEPAYYLEMEQRSQRGDRGRGGNDRGRGGNDRGRGGRPQSRDYDDYDRPRRDRDNSGGGGGGGRGGRGGRGGSRQTPRERPPFEDDAQQIPVVNPEFSEPLAGPNLPPSVEDGPDIIVEEIVTDDDFYEAGPEPADMTEPMEPDEPPYTTDMPPELPPVYVASAPFEHVRDDVEPRSLFDETPPVQEEPKIHDERGESWGTAPPEEPKLQDERSESWGSAPSDTADESISIDEAPVASEESVDEEGKAPKKGRRKPAASKTPRARKPRKSTKKSEDEEPKPRPMDSSEHRTGDGDPTPGPIEPRPVPDLLDEELSFSMAPSPKPPAPAPVPPPPRMEPVIERHFEAPVSESSADVSSSIDEDEPLDAPMAPPMSRFEEEDETMVEIVEEEKALEAELDEADITEIVDDGEPIVDLDQVHDDVDDMMPPRQERDDRGPARDNRGRDDRGPAGDNRGRDDRGGRGRDDRGGRGRDDRGGRGRDDRGGRSGDRGRPFDRDRGRGPGMGMGRPKPHIEDIFKRGQEVLVKVIKEGIGTKGPTLTTYISIAGRYLVLMPGLERIGVSRKIEDDETRRRLREILRELKPPRGIGFIIRTAGQDRNQKELQSDLAYLSRLWQVVVGRIKKQKSPSEIYRESDMVTRTIRDNFTSDIDTIWVDERGAYEAAKEFMEAVMPRYADRIKFYDSTEPMFHKYGIEHEIARIQMRHVPLPYGGSIVIDQTEALVAIDVNSGNFRANNNNAEETAYQMNLHAAKEIARQLRLRDLGGVIANDFIDMREDRHRRGVEKALRDAVRRDRARTKILRISQFGIIEMTRQRIRPSLKRSVYQDCKHCHGTGHVKTGESVSIEVMRMLQLAVHREIIQRIEIRVHDEVALYLQNKKRKDIVALEEAGGKLVTIQGAGGAVSPEHLEFLCFDSNGNEVKFASHDEPPPRPTRRR